MRMWIYKNDTIIIFSCKMAAIIMMHQRQNDAYEKRKKQKQKELSTLLATVNGLLTETTLTGATLLCVNTYTLTGIRLFFANRKTIDHHPRYNHGRDYYKF